MKPAIPDFALFARLTGAGAVTVFVVGCAAATSGDVFPPVTVSDSAGVPVYTLTELPAWDDPRFLWTVDVERSFATDVEGLAGEPEIWGPQGFTRMPDGRLVILDSTDPRLVVVAADSDRVERRFSRTGQGPGEIWAQTTLLWPEGSERFRTLDPGNQRLSLWSLDGDLLEERTVAIAGNGGIPLLRPGTHEAFFWKIFSPDRTPGELVDSVGRFDPTTDSVRFIAPMMPRVEERRVNTNPVARFSPMSWYAPVAGGVVIGRNDRGRFRYYDDEGRLLALIDVPGEQRPIDRALEDEIIEEFLGVARGSNIRRRPVVAERFPLYNLMLPVRDSLFALQQADRAGVAGEPPIPEDQWVWRVFSTRGRYVGAIVLPPSTRLPYWIEPGRITATQRDSLGVATLVTLRIAPPG